MASLPSSPNLSDYQQLIRDLVVERGFDTETVPEVMLLLIEEVGELAKAIRKSHGMKTDDNSQKHTIEEELADVFWLLIDVCNRLDVDLEQAFRAKERVNQSRTWQ